MYGKKRGRRGRGCARGRPIIPRNYAEPIFKHFIPVIPPELINRSNPTPIYIYYDEFEAVRLVDLDRLTQDQAGEKMNISRGTIWRLLQSGREKLMLAIVEGRQIYFIERS
ncbi:MAG: DUF134 domain-containing protein [Candidatus Lokiarchaeota archaeon]|nr:DUF134 domain-containing protein [Candidatus Lokiarchaeota archaeon]